MVFKRTSATDTVGLEICQINVSAGMLYRVVAQKKRLLPFKSPLIVPEKENVDPSRAACKLL